MPEYAMYEVGDLIRRFPSPLNDRDSIVRYVCALFAELAYYHIPRWEITGKTKSRAKIIPCETYQSFINQGISIDMLVSLHDIDLEKVFIVVDRGVIAIGVILHRFLFIGFRGTQLINIYDWKINFRSKLVRIHRSSVTNTVNGRFHSGFFEEALRISSKILDAIRDLNLRDNEIDHVFLTGHSLGGAIAAIAENYLRVAPTSVCIFGTPRYSDLSAYSTLPCGPPTHIRRHDDVVPNTPPRWLGYTDHLYDFTTDGQPYIESTTQSSFPLELWRWVRFLAKRFEPHSIESYRHELGALAKAKGANFDLLPIKTK